MNSKTKYNEKDARCGFGVKIDHQMQNLENMEKLLDSMKFTPLPGSKKKVRETKPFMDGIR